MRKYLTPPRRKKGHKLLTLVLLTVLTCLLAGCVFAENETTACPYCGTQITPEEAGDHRLPGCGNPDHAICVAGPSPEHDEKCEICGGPLCTSTRYHYTADCRKPGHCWGDGEDHHLAHCGIDGHYNCDGIHHQYCNTPSASAGGLDIIQPAASTAETCPACQNPLDDGNDHGATDCHFKSTHRHCDGMEHTRCDICKGWLCNGNTHIPGICNVVPSKEVEEEADDQEDSSHDGDTGTSCPHCGHSPACTLNYSFHSYGPCHAHYTCAEGYQEDQHNTPLVCAIHYDCDPAAQGIDHSICGTCNRGLCSDYHRAHCG